MYPVRVLVGVLGVALSGCADLTPLGVGECGNQVLETGEDCDRSADTTLGSDLSCGAPGSIAACRYVCPGGGSCPGGWGCGADRVCRAPSAELGEPVFSSLASTPSAIASGDFDGDQRTDVVARFPSVLGWAWSNGDGHFSLATATGTSVASGAILARDLDGDQRSDLVAPGVHGLEVWRGSDERQPLPVAYAPFSFPAGAGRVLPLRRKAQPEALALALYSVGSASEAVVATFADGVLHPASSVDPTHGVELLANDIAVGDLNADGTDDVALAFRGATEAKLYSPKLDVLTGRWVLGPLPAAPAIGIASVTACETCAGVEAGFTVDSGVMLVDLDGDAELDLLVSVTRSSGYGDELGVAVARRIPGGGFSQPYLDTRFGQLAKPSGAPGVKSSGRVWPLAISGGPGLPLIVGANGVYEATALGFSLVRERASAEPWTRAVVSDLDGQVGLEVAAIAAGEAQVHVLRRQLGGATFNQLAYNLGSGARALVAGDIRGNSRSDLVVATEGPESSIFALWSNPAAWPSDPQLAAVVSPVAHLAIGLSTSPGLSADSMDDLWVTTQAGPWPPSFGVLSSNGGARLTSPYVLPRNGTARVVVPGRFFEASSGGDGSGLLALGVAEEEIPTAWPLPLAGRAQFAGGGVSIFLRAKISPAFELGCSRFAAADFDGDARDEVAVVFGEGLCGWGPVFLTRGEFWDGPSFTTPRPLGDARVIELASGDLDGDSHSDLALVEQAGVRVFWGSAAWHESASTGAPLPSAGPARAATVMSVRAPRAGGRLAVAVGDSVWLLSVDPQRTLDWVNLTDDRYDLLSAADVDGDGLDDLVATRDAKLAALITQPLPPLGDR